MCNVCNSNVFSRNTNTCGYTNDYAYTSGNVTNANGNGCGCCNNFWNSLWNTCQFICRDCQGNIHVNNCGCGCNCGYGNTSGTANTARNVFLFTGGNTFCGNTSTANNATANTGYGCGYGSRCGCRRNYCNYGWTVEDATDVT